MKILILTNMYPIESKKNWGVFIKEQIESIQKLYSNELEFEVYLINGMKSKWNYISAMISLPAIIRKRKYDIIHAHFGLTLISTVFIKSPIVVTFHGSDLLKFPGKYISKLFKYKVSYSIVVSQNLKKKLGGGTIIPCGIDVEKFFLPVNYNNRKNETGKGIRNKIKVLFPSDPSYKVKNYALFKEACTEIEKIGYNVEEIYLKNIPRNKVPNIYWESDIMILTSFSEGSPTVVKEAIASKLPFIAVDVGDISEWRELINFGIVVQTRDPKIIAKKAIELITGSANREQLENEKAINKMNIFNIAKKIYSIYLKLLN